MTRFSITHTNPVPVPVAVTTDTKFVEPRGANWNLERSVSIGDRERIKVTGRSRLGGRTQSLSLSNAR